jgi:hypothetical protein
MSVHESIITTDCKLLRSELLELKNLLDIQSTSLGFDDKIHLGLENLKREFTYLNEYPSLLEKMCENSRNYGFCIEMIEHIEEIQKGHLSQYEASGVIGTKLAEKYVYTKITDFDKEKDLK